MLSRAAVGAHVLPRKGHPAEHGNEVGALVRVDGAFEGVASLVGGLLDELDDPVDLTCHKWTERTCTLTDTPARALIAHSPAHTLTHSRLETHRLTHSLGGLRPC